MGRRPAGMVRADLRGALRREEGALRMLPRRAAVAGPPEPSQACAPEAAPFRVRRKGGRQMPVRERPGRLLPPAGAREVHALVSGPGHRSEGPLQVLRAGRSGPVPHENQVPAGERRGPHRHGDIFRGGAVRLVGAAGEDGRAHTERLEDPSEGRDEAPVFGRARAVSACHVHQGGIGGVSEGAE